MNFRFLSTNYLLNFMFEQIILIVKFWRLWISIVCVLMKPSRKPVLQKFSHSFEELEEEKDSENTNGV